MKRKAFSGDDSCGIVLIFSGLPCGRGRALSVTFPEDAIERLELRLEGRRVADVRATLEEAYAGGPMETPGIELDDWMQIFQTDGARGSAP